MRARLLLLFALGCSEKVRLPGEVPEADPTRSWLRLLKRAAPDGGVRGVDYAVMERRRDTLQRYLRWVGAHGPELDGLSEGRENKRMAFMMNAYNAAVIEGVLRHQPIESVRDVGGWPWSVRPGAGFFVGQRFRVDGDWQTLYLLEVQDIIGRYQEPLLHVGLNCASRGCPPVRGWDDKDLKEDLEDHLVDWLAADGLVCDAGGCAANAIFDWYRDDFLDWSEAENLCQYLEPFAQGDEREWLLLHHADCPLQFQEYDWSLNALLPEEGGDDAAPSGRL